MRECGRDGVSEGGWERRGIREGGRDRWEGGRVGIRDE